MTDFQVVFMDAGQGDCTLIVYPDNSLTLVDCGSTKSGDEAFAEIWVVLSGFLKNNNNTLNNLVLTHPDEDHYNKLKALFAKKPTPKVGRVYYGGDIELYKNKKDANFTYDFLLAHKKNGTGNPPKNTFSVEPDPWLSWTQVKGKEVKVTILAANASGSPKARAGAKKNTNSIVLMVEYGSAKIFLMGDAFVETEDFIRDSLKVKKRPDLIQKGSAKAAEAVLKMGHHGSDTSTGSDWIQAITPNILVISSGTKRFRGKGMPTVTHLDATVKASPLVATGIDQSYVVFDETQRGVSGKDFKMMPKTDKGIWTTCYGVDWVDQRWREWGQTWYYGVSAKVGHWYGFTGYEEADNVDDDDTI